MKIKSHDNSICKLCSMNIVHADILKRTSLELKSGLLEWWVRRFHNKYPEGWCGGNWMTSSNKTQVEVASFPIWSSFNLLPIQQSQCALKVVKERILKENIKFIDGLIVRLGTPLNQFSFIYLPDKGWVARIKRLRNQIAPRFTSNENQPLWRGKVIFQI